MTVLYFFRSLVIPGKFQVDMTTFSESLPIISYLDATFPHKWIGRRGFREWPTKSPDLSMLEFFYWGSEEVNLQ